MSDPSPAQEPSMEEILSSIRRIIADEDTEGALSETPKAVIASVKPQAAMTQAADSGDGVLELTDVVEEPSAAMASAPPAKAGNGSAVTVEAPQAAERRGIAPQPAPRPAEAETLLSAAAASVSAQALAKLTRAVAPEQGTHIAAGVTVEQLVIELLKPALKDWLEANLPPIVERVVEQEVKKLARRAELM